MNYSALNTNATVNYCAVIGMNKTIPWDNPHNLVSLEAKKLIEAVKTAVLMPLIFAIGAPANLINMVVFAKQGLNERINICLFLLSLVDLVLLTFILIYQYTRVPDPFSGSGVYGQAYIFIVNNNVRGLYGVNYVSMFLAAVISTERCVCVLFPLRAQRCIRTRSFACALIVGMCVVGFLRFVVTAKYRAACFYEERTGRESWQISLSDFYRRNKDVVNLLDGALYGFSLSLGCPLVVLLTTVITVVKLRQIVRWRDHASSAISSKEIGVTKMLICLSIEFLILTFPRLCLRVLPMFGSEIKPGGRHANMFVTLVSVSEIASYLSSSVNFFVYVFTGSRYRETLHQLFSRKSSPEQLEGSKITQN